MKPPIDKLTLIPPTLKLNSGLKIPTTGAIVGVNVIGTLIVVVGLMCIRVVEFRSGTVALGGG